MKNARFDITSLGETMLRLSVPAGERLETAAQFDINVGGTESNTLSALSRLNRRCGWLGALPQNALGRRVVNPLQMAGVNVEAVVWSEQGRLGIYFVEFAGPPRSTQVIYDRAGSCMAQLQPDQVDWSYLLDSCLLHLTGITPAISANAKAIVTEAVARAKEAGLALSFDVNYRQKLWTEADARETLLPLIQQVDLLFCGQADAQRVFGCSGSPQQIINSLLEQSNAQQLVVSLSDQGVIGWDGSQFLEVAAQPVQVIDRVGAGDALAAGVIHGWLDGDLGQGLRYGVTMAALALSQHGDIVITTPQELETLLESEGADIKR